MADGSCHWMIPKNTGDGSAARPMGLLGLKSRDMHLIFAVVSPSYGSLVLVNNEGNY